MHVRFYLIFTGLNGGFYSSASSSASPSSFEAVKTLPDKEITLFQLGQVSKVAHHMTAQAVWPAQGENVWLEARKEGVGTAGPRRFLKSVLQKQLLTFEAFLCNYKRKVRNNGSSNLRGRFRSSGSPLFQAWNNAQSSSLNTASVSTWWYITSINNKKKTKAIETMKRKHNRG